MTTLNNMEERERIAKELLAKHGLQGWTFKWDRAKRRFGLCSYKRKTIQLSSVLAKEVSLEESIDTILHEIAHALVGHAHGHDATWKRKCIEIGCRPERCGKRVALPRTWKGDCPTCDFSISRFKRLNASCPRCDKHFNPKNLIVWTKL